MGRHRYQIEDLRQEAQRLVDRITEKGERINTQMDIVDVSGDVPQVNVFDFPLADVWQPMSYNGENLGEIRRLANGGRDFLATHWRTSKGISMGAHTHSMKEVMVVTSGEMQYNIAGKKHTLLRGDTITVDKGVVHSVRCEGPASVITSWFE